jgi:NAD(P)-dependent dehydrogenase (short-subunit alcohol dehydrogenase family)
MEFKDRTVLITGAAGNLGRAVANVFAERGADLVLAAYRASPR